MGVGKTCKGFERDSRKREERLDQVKKRDLSESEEDSSRGLEQRARVSKNLKSSEAQKLRSSKGSKSSRKPMKRDFKSSVSISISISISAALEFIAFRKKKPKKKPKKRSGNERY